MIDLYYWPTPNGHKITMFLEETGMPYTLIPVNIGKGEQFRPEFLAISPNNRMPAIVDHAPMERGAPVSVFESGAILLYLAEKSGTVPRQGFARPGRGDAMAVLAGGRARPHGRSESSFFAGMRPRRCPMPSIATSRRPTASTGCSNKRLADREFIAGAYSIADMAAYPWIVPHEAQGQNLDEFPHLKRWFEAIKSRPATLARLRARRGDQQQSHRQRGVAKNSVRSDGAEHRAKPRSLRSPRAIFGRAP